MKFVKKPAEGEGKCPGKWDKARLEFSDCNMKRCELESTSDAVLLPEYGGTKVKLGEDDMFLFREDDILGKFD